MNRNLYKLIFWILLVFPLYSGDRYTVSDPGQVSVVAARSGLYLRTEPSTLSKKICIIPFGEHVKIISKTDTIAVIDDIEELWLYAEYNGKKGFLFGGYLSPVGSPLMPDDIQGRWYLQTDSRIYDKDGEFSLEPEGHDYMEFSGLRISFGLNRSGAGGSGEFDLRGTASAWILYLQVKTSIDSIQAEFPDEPEPVEQRKLTITGYRYSEMDLSDKGKKSRYVRTATPFHDYAQLDDPVRMKEIYNAQSLKNPDIAVFGNLTALHFAAAKGSAAAAAYLIASGANVNARNFADATPLHYAVWYEHPEMAALLIKNKADVSARTKNGVTVEDIIINKMKQSPSDKKILEIRKILKH